MPSIYIILGAADSGRREIVYDLIHEGLGGDIPAVLFTATTETSCPYDRKLADSSNVTVLPWQFGSGEVLATAIPEEAEVVFFLADGRQNPIDQLEAIREWIEAQGLELARILTVVHCGYAFEHKELEEWYAACIHFSDCVLMNYRDGLPASWINDFQKRFEDNCLPCLFDNIKQGRVSNPALILNPEPRRLSLAFDPMEEEEDLGEDPYFERLPTGTRCKRLPNINEFLA